MILEGFPQKKLRILPFVLYFMGFQLTILAMNAFVQLSVIGLFLLVILFMGFYSFLRDSFISFEYKWLEGALHLERVLSKGNHVYIVIEKEQIKALSPFDRRVRIGQSCWFCHKSEVDGLYLLTVSDGKQYVFKPSPALKEAICAQSAV